MAADKTSQKRRFLTASQCLQSLNAEMRLAAQGTQHNKAPDIDSASDGTTFQAAPGQNQPDDGESAKPSCDV